MLKGRIYRGAAGFLLAVFEKISPELREQVEALIYSLWKRASSTDNKMDDVAVKILAALVGVDIPK